MTRICHTHRSQTNPWHHEEKIQEDEQTKHTHTKGVTQLKSQELEVQSLYYLCSLKTKSSQRHLTMSLRNDIGSFWFQGYRGNIGTELQVEVVNIKNLAYSSSAR